jgi:hypothetical protein
MKVGIIGNGRVGELKSKSGSLKMDWVPDKGAGPF